MNPSMSSHQLGDLHFIYDPANGQILNIHDTRLDMEIIAFRPGHELEINRVPLDAKLVDMDDPALGHPAWQCNLKATEHTAIGTARGFNLFRQVVVGSAFNPGANHNNPPQSLSIRYRLDRCQVERYATPDPASAGQRPIQMPLWLETIGLLCGRTDWFGPETRMLQAAVGGCGPRSHVGLEDNKVAEVTPHLWNTFRSAHPGCQTVPGAVYYHPDGRWVWITAQNPSVGMHWEFGPEGQVARFEYHGLTQPAEILHPPEVTLYWGNGGRDEFMGVLAKSFVGYSEPPEWFFNTTWFWPHWWSYRENGFYDVADQIRYLHEHLGITGFGLTSHDVRPGNWDCAPNSLDSMALWGGEDGLRAIGETVKSFGGHAFTWMPFLGLTGGASDLRNSWRIRGEDGRPYESFWIGSFDLYNAVNFDHPEVQAYYLDRIRRNVLECGIDGIFWDCGGVPFPPDFSPAAERPWQRWPSECMTAGNRFLKKVLAEGRRLSPDFFMWHEMIGSEIAGNGYSSKTGNDAFVAELNRHMRKRLVWRSCSTYNLYGGMPTIRPASDVGIRGPVTRESFKSIVEDPMNRWLVDFVRTHSIRDAEYLGEGVALLANHIIADPSVVHEKGSTRIKEHHVSLDPARQPVRRLVDIHSGTAYHPVSRSETAVHFDLPGGAAFVIEG